MTLIQGTFQYSSLQISLIIQQYLCWNCLQRIQIIIHYAKIFTYIPYKVMKINKSQKRQAKLIRSSFYDLIAGIRKKTNSSLDISHSQLEPRPLKPYRSIRQLKTLISQQKSRHLQRPPPLRPVVLIKQNQNTSSSSFLQKDELMGIIKLKLNKQKPLCSKPENSTVRRDYKNHKLFKAAISSANKICLDFDNCVKKERTDLIIRNSKLPRYSQGRSGEIFVSLTERTYTSKQDRYHNRSMTSQSRLNSGQEQVQGREQYSAKYKDRVRQGRRREKGKQLSGWQVPICDQEGFILQKEEIKRKVKQICK